VQVFELLQYKDQFLFFSPLFTFVSLLFTFVESRRVPYPPVSIPRWVEIRWGVGAPTLVVCAVVAGGPPSPPSSRGVGGDGANCRPVPSTQYSGGRYTPPPPLRWRGETGSTATLTVLHHYSKTSPAVSPVLSPPAPGNLLIRIKSVLPLGCARDWS